MARLALLRRAAIALRAFLPLETKGSRLPAESFFFFSLFAESNILLVRNSINAGKKREKPYARIVIREMAQEERRDHMPHLVISCVTLQVSCDRILLSYLNIRFK